MTRQFLLGALVCLALTGITCAPRDVSPPTDSNHGTGSGENGGTPGNGNSNPKDGLLPVPDDYLKRIDAARESIRRRHPHTEFGFWTVFHYILGVGPHKAELRDAVSGKLVNAVQYICEGNQLPGLVFREMPDGSVEVVTRAGSGDGQGHQDQFVAEMVQWGMPLTQVFKVNGNKHTFADFVRFSKMNASTSLKKRQELSWAVLIIAEHYGTDHKWTNNFGEKLSLEDVVQYEIDDPISPTTTCGGTHRLFDLTWVYFRHRERGGKKDGVWLKTLEYLDKYKKQARDFQNKDGSFSTKYVYEPNSEGDVELRINTTGHVLEWLSLYLADEELREPWILDAVRVLTGMLLQNANRSFDGGSYYHAAHALEIYRTRVFGAADSHPPVIPPRPKD